MATEAYLAPVRLVLRTTAFGASGVALAMADRAREELAFHSICR